jgi:uncharacterized lipoprotein
MQMKKLVTGFVAALLVACLAACGMPKGDTQVSTNDTKQPRAAQQGTPGLQQHLQQQPGNGK